MGSAVKAVSAVAVGVTVGFATENPWLGFAAGAAAYGSSALQKKPKVNAAASQAEMKQIIRSSKEPVRWTFGHVGAGALLAWAQEEPGKQDFEDDEALYLVYVLSEGSITALDQIYMDQDPIGNAGDRASWELLRDLDSADDYLLANSPDWQSTQIGRGISFVRITLKYDKDYFTSGIPSFLFEQHGLPVYDPRTEQTGYSNNCALVILWYVRHRLNTPDDEIMWDTFSEAANICAETVTTPDGSTESRYAFNGQFKADERKDQLLDDMLATCAGNLIRIGGKIGLLVGAYYGPADFTIDESMVTGSVSGQTEVSRSDAVNTVRGTFIDPGQRWAETDYPAVSVQEWIDEDGEQIEDDLDLRFVTSAYQAQRLANIQLRRKRNGGQIKLSMNLAGYACRPGRVVTVDLPSVDLDGEFRVIDWQFSVDGGAEVTLQAESADTYDDAVGQSYTPPGFISLPTGGMASPTGLRYTVETVGEVQQGRLTWDPVAGALHYNVIVKRGSNAVQSAQVPGSVSTLPISGLAAGDYVAEVYARGALGTSGAATVTFAILQPPKPDRVVVTESRDSIMLIPILEDGDLGGGTWEFYWSTDGDIADSEVGTRASFLSRGASVTHNGRTPGQTYYYWIRGINAYGKSEWLSISAQTNQNFDDIWTALQEELQNEGTLFDTIVEGVSPGVLEQIDADLDSYRQQLANNGQAISELQQGSDEQALKMLLLKAAGESSASTLKVEQVVRANLARQVTTLQTGQAKVEDDLYTIYDPETDGFTAAAIRTVDVGGTKAVLGMRSNGEIAEIGAVADRFYIYNEVSGEMVLAFVVEDGRVVMPEALIGKVNIQKLVTDTGETLIEGGKIKTKFLDVDALTAKEIVSKIMGYNGRPSFALREDGSYEFNSTSSDGGGMRWNGETMTVQDSSGTTRIKLGRL